MQTAPGKVRFVSHNLNSSPVDSKCTFYSLQAKLCLSLSVAVNSLTLSLILALSEYESGQIFVRIDGNSSFRSSLHLALQHSRLLVLSNIVSATGVLNPTGLV